MGVVGKAPVDDLVRGSVAARGQDQGVFGGEAPGDSGEVVGDGGLMEDEVGETRSGDGLEPAPAAESGPSGGRGIEEDVNSAQRTVTTAAPDSVPTPVRSVATARTTVIPGDMARSRPTELTWAITVSPDAP